MGETKGKIVGVASVLMNRFMVEQPEESKAKGRDERYSPQVYAEKAIPERRKLLVVLAMTFIFFVVTGCGLFYKRIFQKKGAILF